MTREEFLAIADEAVGRVIADFPEEMFTDGPIPESLMTSGLIDHLKQHAESTLIYAILSTVHAARQEVFQGLVERRFDGTSAMAAREAQREAECGNLRNRIEVGMSQLKARDEQITVLEKEVKRLRKKVRKKDREMCELLGRDCDW